MGSFERLSENGRFPSGMKLIYEAQVTHGLDSCGTLESIGNKREKPKKLIKSGYNLVSTKSCEGKFNGSMSEEPVTTYIFCRCGMFVLFFY